MTAKLSSMLLSRPETANGGTDDPMELGHGRLPTANSKGNVELREVRVALTFMQSQICSRRLALRA
jgi:hypothetical protein